MGYINEFISDKPAELSSEIAAFYKSTLKIFPEEALYIYSFPERKLIYTDGWEEILGYKNEEISLLKILDLTVPKYKPFSKEFNEKAVAFVLNQTERLEEYSFLIELEKIHKNGKHIPLIARVGVYKTVNGKISEVIGRFQVSKSIRLGEVMKYAAFGPDKSEFESSLNKELFKFNAISRKELEAIDLVSKGLTFKEIAAQFGISHSAVEKRILPLYQKFNVKSLTHLVKFCYENQLLPIETYDR